MASTTKNTITKLFSERKRNPSISWLLRNLRKDLGKTKRSLFTDVCIFNSFVLKKIQATSHWPTSCGFSEFFNWCQTMDGVFSYHILLPSIQYSKCYHLCVKWMKRAKHFWSGRLIWSWGTERAGDTFLSSLMNEQSWITSIYLNFKLHDLADFATVNVHDIFAANRLCHVAAHSITRASQAWSILYSILSFLFDFCLPRGRSK